MLALTGIQTVWILAIVGFFWLLDVALKASEEKRPELSQLTDWSEPE